MCAIPVSMVIDDKYLPFAATTLFSICEHTNSNIKCYIFAHNVSLERKKFFVDSFSEVGNLLTVAWVDVSDDLLEDFKTGRHISVVTYARIFIPEFVLEEEKIIFTDVDVLFQGDIEELYQEEFDNFLLCAVPEDDAEDGHIEDKKRLGVPENASYFSAGLLLIDCERWRREGWTGKLLRKAKENADRLKYYDQDLLNQSLCSSYKSLKKKWCWIRQRAKTERENIAYLKDPGIRHFNGRTKPWLCFPWKREVSERLGTREFWSVAKKTAFFDEICAIRASKGKLVRLLGKSFTKKFITFLLKL